MCNIALKQAQPRGTNFWFLYHKVQYCPEGSLALGNLLLFFNINLLPRVRSSRVNHQIYSYWSRILFYATLWGFNTHFAVGIPFVGLMTIAEGNSAAVLKGEGTAKGGIFRSQSYRATCSIMYIMVHWVGTVYTVYPGTIRVQTFLRYKYNGNARI